MKKLIKTIFAGGFALSCGAIAITNVSCGKKSGGGGDGSTFSAFQKAGSDDANNIMTSHKSFGVTNYWGTAGISDEETAKLGANFLKFIQNNVDTSANFKTDVNGAFEEPFDTDATNTIAMAFLTAKKGDPITNIFSNAKIIFNSWDKKSYDSKNWGDQDVSPDYSINKFYDSLKTDQKKLLTILGGAQTDNAHLMYAKASKFTLNSLTGNSHLSGLSPSLNKNWSLNVDNDFPITTTYTLALTSADSVSNIVNIKSDFSFKKGDTAPTSTNITDKTFSGTSATSALKASDIQTELKNFLAMPDITGKSTFEKVWEKQISYIKSGGGGEQVINDATSITIGNVSDKGEILIAVVDKDGKTINLTTTETITKGFGTMDSTKNPDDHYARFVKANYVFEDGQKWGDGPNYLPKTMMSVLDLKSNS